MENNQSPLAAPNANNAEQEAANGVLDNMGVEMGALLDEWRLSKSYVEQYTRDFPQLDSIVDGIPVQPQSDTPFVGDTTLAGLVRSIPRNSLQQLPILSVTVNGTKNSIPALLCTYLLKKTAFNEDTFGKGLLSTLQIGAQQALTHGYAPFTSTMGQQFNSYGTTLRLMHFSDTSPEPGITDHNETGYDYTVNNLTPSAVRKILRKALKNPNSTWNAPALQRLLQTTPKTKTYSIYQTAAEQLKGGDDNGPTYEIVTRKEYGTDTIEVSFCPDLEEAPLRVKEGVSKFGYPTVNYLVIDPAALTPFGISRVRLASPNQNMMNIYYANIAAMLLLNSAPPILKRGRFTKPVQLKRNAVWETLDQNAAADLKTIDNGALEQFPSMAQQFAGQIQSMMGSTVGSPNQGGSSGFSKTSPGVKMQQSFEDTSSNQITKIMENFLRQHGLSSLDLLLSEQAADGGPDFEEPIIVDDDTMNAINTIAENKWLKANPGAPPAVFIPPIGDDHKIMMNWYKFYDAIEEWSVSVDVSLSPDQLEDKKRGDIQDTLVTLAQNAQFLGPEAQQKITELTNMLMADVTPIAGQISGGSAPSPVSTPAAPAQAVTAPMPDAPPPAT